MIHTLTESAKAIDVSEDAKDFATHELNGYTKLVFSSVSQDPLKCGGDMIYVGQGNWEILGKPASITNTDWFKIVDKFNNGSYRDYEHKNFDSCDEYLPMYLTAQESGQSLLKSKNVNPESVIILIKKQ
jgi:hypothetical protein